MTAGTIFSDAGDCDRMERINYVDAADRNVASRICVRQKEGACGGIKYHPAQPGGSDRSNAPWRRAGSCGAEDSARLGRSGCSKLRAVMARNIRVEASRMAGSAGWHRGPGRARECRRIGGKDRGRENQPRRLLLRHQSTRCCHFGLRRRSKSGQGCTRSNSLEMWTSDRRD